jgi:hypothetical protein
MTKTTKNEFKMVSPSKFYCFSVKTSKEMGDLKLKIQSGIGKLNEIASVEENGKQKKSFAIGPLYDNKGKFAGCFIEGVSSVMLKKLATMGYV